MKRSLWVVILAFALLLLASSVGLAAEPALEKPAKLIIKVDLTDAKNFWSYPYITSDGKVHKPAAISLEWTVGISSKVMKQTIIVPDKTTGEYSIVTERGALVNLQIFVVDAGNNPLGAASLQLRNDAQREQFYVGMPDVTSPIITHDVPRLQ